MGSMARRRILRARGSTASLLEAAGAADARFAGAAAKLDAARHRHRREARLDASRAAWAQQHAALVQAAKRCDGDDAPPPPCVQINELRTMVACLAQTSDDQTQAKRRAAAIVARMMVDAREAHAATGASLDAEEEAARCYVEAAAAAVSAALRANDAEDAELANALHVDEDEAFLAPALEELRAAWAARHAADGEARRGIDAKLRDAVTAIGDGSAALDGRGAWNDAAHVLFETHMRTPAAKTLERLRVVLPQFSDNEIKKHVAHFEACHLHATELHICRRDAKAWRAEFLITCGKTLAAARRDHVECAEKDAQYIEMGRRQRALHACVQKLRSERERRDAKAAVERDLLEEERSTRDAAKHARAEEAQRRAKDAILHYKAEQFRADAEARVVDEAARREREAAQRASARHGAARATYREGVRDARHAERASALERIAKEDEARAIALEALARSVPYFETIQNLASDVHKTTAATEAQRADHRTDADKGGYVSGLTDERVFRDPAFKIGLKMRALGVAGTGAARDAVSRLVGPRARDPVTGARC